MHHPVEQPAFARELPARKGIVPQTDPAADLASGRPRKDSAQGERGPPATRPGLAQLPSPQYPALEAIGRQNSARARCPPLRLLKKIGSDRANGCRSE